MDEPVVKVINRGGRPRKYANAAEKRAADSKRRAEKRAAALMVPLPAPDLGLPSAASPLQTAIAKAVAGLSVQHATFVTAVCGGTSLAKSYRQAYPDCAETTANTHGAAKAGEPEIAKAIAEVKAALALSVAYDFTSFMTEMDQAMTFAKQTRNATALVRAVELRGKATGHLADKPQGGADAGFTLVISGIEAPATLERVDG